MRRQAGENAGLGWPFESGASARHPKSKIQNPKSKIAFLLEMIKFSHTLFALPFALLAGVMATRSELWEGRSVRPLDWLGIVLCMVFARSTAMAFNRLADQAFDAENPRTRARHLPAGLLARPAVVAFVLVCAVGFVASAALFGYSSGNRLPLMLAGPVLAFLCLYSYTKRFTALSHFWLGAALMLAPLSTWIAIRGQVEWAPVILGGAVLFWVAGFDMIYACQDVEFDRRKGLRSIPARLGVRGALALAAACHAIMVLLLATLPLVFPLGWIYAAGAVAVAALLAYEHSLVRPHDLTRVGRAFFHVNSIVSAGLLIVTALDMWLCNRPPG
jgi:4-hydroxybenzoate polyprenyltransferase